MSERDELLKKIVNDQRILSEYILKKRKIIIDKSKNIFESNHPPYLLIKRLERLGEKFPEEIVCKAILEDRLYSPIASIVHEIRGKYYENIIEDYLRKFNITFRRGRRNKKEPDFLLDKYLEIDGERISWIESKFFYGNKEIHEYFKRKQFSHYKRYGKGMIIYWLGFDIKENEFVIKDFRFFSKNFPHIKIYDMGYSGRNFDEFLKILKNHDIKAVIDVRRYPRSKYKEYNKEYLEKILKENDIEYVWIESLGGFRKGYEKYMYTKNFINGIIYLLNVMKRHFNILIICRERNYLYCHRRYILKVLGEYFETIHL